MLVDELELVLVDEPELVLDVPDDWVVGLEVVTADEPELDEIE